jgi:hypothetical protein
MIRKEQGANQSFVRFSEQRAEQDWFLGGKLM